MFRNMLGCNGSLPPFVSRAGGGHHPENKREKKKKINQISDPYVSVRPRSNNHMTIKSWSTRHLHATELEKNVVWCCLYTPRC